jgi:hypothetical protein
MTTERFYPIKMCVNRQLLLSNRYYFTNTEENTKKTFFSRIIYIYLQS